MVINRTQRATEQRVIDMVGWVLRTPSNRLFSYTDFQEDLNLDPLDLLLLIAQLEHHFNIYLSGEEVESIRTIGDAASCFGKEARA